MALQDKNRYWRFWPVIVLAFLYPANIGVVGLAIPLYYLKQGLSIQIIGYLSAGTSITYWFSPVLFTRISKRMGRKTSIIIATVGTMIAQGVFYISLEPTPILISRMIEGTVMGLYWANLQSSISDNPSADHSYYMSRYNISWNAGVVVGQVAGTIVLFLMDDLLIIFYISPILVILMVIISATFFQEQQVPEERPPEDIIVPAPQLITQPMKSSSANRDKHYIPILLPVLFVVAFVMGRQCVLFLYPIKSVALGYETFSVYFLSFMGIAFQMVSTSLASLIPYRRIRIVPLVTVSCMILIVLLFSITEVFIIFLLLFMIMGFCGGLMYSLGLKLFITLNVNRNTSIFSSLCESIIGLVFLIVPVILGYLVELNGLMLGFNVDAIVLSVVLVLIFIALRNYREM